MNETNKKIKVIVIKPEIYSRIVGYFRPVQYWNIGKRQEFKDRKNFKINKGGLYEKK